MTDNKKVRLDNLFYLFEENYFERENWNEYLSARINKVLAFDEWFNSLNDEEVIDFLDIEENEVDDYRLEFNKGIVAWLGEV